MNPRIVTAKTYQEAAIANPDEFIAPLDESRDMYGIWPSAMEYCDWRKNGGTLTLKHEND